MNLPKKLPKHARALVASVVAAVVLAAGIAPIGAAPLGGEPHVEQVAVAGDCVPGELIVTFADSAPAAQRAEAHRKAGVARGRVLGSEKRAELVRLPQGMSVAEGLAAYRGLPGVLAVQPNYVYTAQGLPDDPYFGELWGLHNVGQDGGTADVDIDAPEAWALSTGEASVVVAVIDSGVDHEHPDLSASMWANPGEIADNFVDDDGNGFVDDVHGYDFLVGDPDPMDALGHGTHVAGTVAAQMGNGTGVAGVAPGVRIMALRFLDADGDGSTADAIDAIGYADLMGADIINASWGGKLYDPALEAALAAYEGLVVCAAGNLGANIDGSTRTYPAAMPLDNIVSVASIDRNGVLASSSNYGALGVDLAAPGVAVTSTYPAPRPAPVLGSTLFQDDFADLSSWDVSTYAQQPWSLTDLESVSGTSCAGNVPYVDDEDAWLVLVDPVDLSAVSGPVLEFWLYRDIDTPADAVTVWANEGSGWRELQFDPGYSRWTFSRCAADLTPYAGQPSVAVAFRLESDGSVSSANGYAGAFVDDVRIAEATWPPTDFSDAYDTLSGTSMAAPHVSGILALLKSERPAWSTTQLKSRLLDRVDVSAALAGKCVSGGRANAASVLDFVGPTATDDHLSTYFNSATVRITAADDVGVSTVTYELDGAQRVVSGDRATVVCDVFGEHTLRYYATDVGGNDSVAATAGFEIVRGAVTLDSVEGANRYETAIAASKRAYPEGAPAVVVATGANWPDALGGSALAGAVGGPLLLTPTSALPDAVASEIDRLSATRAYVLGGTGAVSVAVENELRLMLGGVNVVRLAGPDRYATADLVAEEVVRLAGADFAGEAFVATGANFPDALGASPLAASLGAPILLVPRAAVPRVPAGVERVTVLGGTGAVSSAVEEGLVARLGPGNVVRVGGADRYETAALVAERGVAAGMRWNGVGVATGASFPDAMSGGAMLGAADVVMLLTPPTGLAPAAQSRLSANREAIGSVTVIGGSGAVSPDVRTAIATILR